MRRVECMLCATSTQMDPLAPLVGGPDQVTREAGYVGIMGGGTRDEGVLSDVVPASFILPGL